MQAKFICHKDFSDRRVRNVFHKESESKTAHDDGAFTNKHVLFRKKLCINRVINAVLRITADDRFRLYINGNYVTQGPPPGYPQKYYYMEIDVSRFLVCGENVIAVHTYYQGLINRVWVSGDGRQCLWCELLIDGEKAAASDGSWLCAYHDAYSSCGIVGYDTAVLERYDSGGACIGFEKYDFDDSAWEHAEICKHADYHLVKSPLEPLAEETYAPQKTKQNGQTLFLDFGREMAGNLRLCAEGKKGSKILLRVGEELNADGSVRYDMRCNCRYEEEWILSGKLDALEQFDYKAFRYAEIVCPPCARIIEAHMRVRHYPYERKARFSVDDARMRPILELCENTVRYGVQENYPDCMTREKGQYLGDMCVSGRAHVALTGDTALLKKSVEDFCESSFICKGLMAVAPASFMQEIADYTLQLPSLILWIYSVDKDEEFVRRTAPYVRGIFDYYTAYCAFDGLLDGVSEKWNLVDWPQNCRDGYDFELTVPIGKGKHNVLNAFWIDFLQSSDKIFGMAGYPETGKTEKAKASFTRCFYNEKTGLFCDSEKKSHSSFHSNVLPLLFGIGTENAQIKRKLTKYICARGLRAGSVLFAYYALAALVKNGETKKAVALAAADDAWYTMLREGATTTFEAWSKDMKWNTSLFHPWATAPAIVFCADVKPY